MAEYQKTIITNAGISVLNRVLANKATMTFTRAVSSTDDLSGKTEADLRSMTSFSNIMQNGICSSYDIHNQNMVSLDLVFTNEGLGNSYLINTVGLYAKPSDSSTEVLYAIARAGKDSNGNSLAEQMPAYVDSQLTKFTISLFTQVGQSSSVAVSITDEGVVKSINSLTPDESGNVVVDTSIHAKVIQEQLNSGQIYIPVLDDAGNPLTDESGNVLLNTQYLPKTISINGGQKVEADSSNNIDLQTYTKQVIKNWMETKVDQADADLAHRALQAQIDANLANEVTARTNGDNSVLTQAKAYTDTAKSDLTTAMANEVTARTNGDNSVLTQAKAYTDTAKTGLTTAMNNFYQKSDIDSKLSAATKGVVKSINSLTPDTNGNVVVDTSSHAKAIQEQLNSGKLYIPVLDDAGNPLTDESGNVLLNTQYLPKTISINGGQKVEADSSNNINLQTYTKQVIKNWMETKVDQTDADLAHRALQAQIDANLANEATARTNGDNSVLSQAKAYTDTAKSDLTTAMANEVTARTNGDNSVLTQAKAYTDASKAAWTPIVITAAVDLNTIQTCGSYFIQNTLGTTSNTPIPNSWLFVRVEGVPTRITQTVWKDIDPVNQWVRFYTDTNSWGNWVQITKAI